MTLRLWHVLFGGTALVVAIVGVRYVAKPIPTRTPAPASALVRPKPVAANTSAATAQALIASAVPSIEAYSADHNGYDGMTADGLRTYDGSLSQNLVVRTSSGLNYCIEATVQGQTFKKSGPSSSIGTGPCA